jgi:hypothetical protein
MNGQQPGRTKVTSIVCFRRDETFDTLVLPLRAAVIIPSPVDPRGSPSAAVAGRDPPYRRRQALRRPFSLMV